MRRFFGIRLEDVIRGDGPSPVLVLLAVRALPDHSLTVALASGGWDHYGWGADRHIWANIYDAINLNTRASGNWGKKGPPRLPDHPRPKRAQGPGAFKKVTARQALLRMIGRG